MMIHRRSICFRPNFGDGGNTNQIILRCHSDRLLEYADITTDGYIEYRVNVPRNGVSKLAPVTQTGAVELPIKFAEMTDCYLTD